MIRDPKIVKGDSKVFFLLRFKIFPLAITLWGNYRGFYVGILPKNWGALFQDRIWSKICKKIICQKVSHYGMKFSGFCYMTPMRHIYSEIVVILYAKINLSEINTLWHEIFSILLHDTHEAHIFGHCGEITPKIC